jgi:hypothetical protein
MALDLRKNVRVDGEVRSEIGRERRRKSGGLS